MMMITIQTGRTTMLILKNQDKKEHTFTVARLQIDAEVQPGKEKTLPLNLKKPLYMNDYVTTISRRD